MRIFNLSFDEREHDVKDFILTLPESDFLTLFKPVLLYDRNLDLKRRTLEWLSDATGKSPDEIMKNIINKRLP
jgi:hypothetical protein